MDKTSVYYHYDQNNLAENGQPIKVWGIGQTLRFPTVYGAQKRTLENKVERAENQYELNRFSLEKEVSKAYQQVVYWKMVNQNYQYLDSLYAQFVVSAQARKKEIDILRWQSEQEIARFRSLLNQWIQSDTLYDTEEQTLSRFRLSTLDTVNHPGINLYAGEIALANSYVKLERQQLLPDIQLEAFQGTNNGPNAKTYSGFKVGLAIPLFFTHQSASVAAAKVQQQVSQSEYNNYKNNLMAGYRALLADIAKYSKALDYYDASGKDLARAIVLNANKSFKNGEIDFLQYTQLLENATNIEINYLNNLINYNLAVIEANYFMN
jgi:cobalt-zinc-cadmium resistance protein CzcA